MWEKPSRAVSVVVLAVVFIATGPLRSVSLAWASYPGAAGALYTISVTGKRLRHLTAPTTSASGCPRPSRRAVLCVEGRAALSPAGGQVAFTALSVCTSQCGGPSFPPQCISLSERLITIDLRGRIQRSDRVATNECQPDFGLADDTLAGVAWQPLPGGG